MKEAFLAIVLVTAAATSIGCGSAAPRTMGSQAVCEANCDHAVALSCAKTPSNYGENCKMLCAVSRSTFPNCTAQIDAMSACIADHVTFVCQDDVPTPTPLGVCRFETEACAACTGNFIGCTG